jgi:hypothetical protein
MRPFHLPFQFSQKGRKRLDAVAQGKGASGRVKVGIMAQRQRRVRLKAFSAMMWGNGWSNDFQGERPVDHEL